MFVSSDGRVCAWLFGPVDTLRDFVSDRLFRVCTRALAEIVCIFLIVCGHVSSSSLVVYTVLPFSSPRRAI